MVCYKLVADWGNPALSKWSSSFGSSETKQHIRSNHTMVLWKCCPWWKRNDLNNLRQNWFWILSANVVVRGMIYRCFNCCKLCGKFDVQKMADLPKVRCLDVPPFTHCGVDMFGPYTIRERRSDLKRYRALFTCFASRAVHIEVTNALETNSFIQAIKDTLQDKVLFDQAGQIMVPILLGQQMN